MLDTERFRGFENPLPRTEVRGWHNVHRIKVRGKVCALSALCALSLECGVSPGPFQIPQRLKPPGLKPGNLDTERFRGFENPLPRTEVRGWHNVHRIRVR